MDNPLTSCVYDFNSQEEAVKRLALEGYSRGFTVGFRNMYPLYSVKRGCTTYMCGHEYSGKSEFMMEIAVQMAERHNLKSAIFSPESGEKQDLFFQLEHKVLRMPPNEADEQAKLKAEIFTQEHFWAVDPGADSLTFDQLYEQLMAYERRAGITFDILFVDPWNELKPDMSGQSIQQWLEELLGKVRRLARVSQKHIFIVTHPRETDRLWHADGYTLPPTRKDYALGQAWPRKGEAMITKWRPPYKEGEDGVNVFGENEEPYAVNEAHVIINKAKPKGVGQHGMAKLFYDPYRSRYYELFAGSKYYAWEFMNENKHLYDTRY